MKEVEIEFVGERLVLSPLRAVYWLQKKTLILSDLHLGKSAHFRKNGIPVSSLVNESDMLRLDHLIDRYPTEKVVVVGDLIHAGINAETARFQTWLATRPGLQVSLIKGNHDRVKIDHLLGMGLHEVLDHGFIEPFSFFHDPPKSATAGTISGHLHPGILLDMPFRKRIKLPCFVVTPSTLILPAFSEFTGLDTVNHPEGARYYAIVENEVVPI